MWRLGVLLTCLLFVITFSQAQPAAKSNPVVDGFVPLPPLPLLQSQLAKQAPSLSPTVLKLALAAAQQASVQGIVNNQVLTVIDYGLPANVKRLWVFDLKKPRLLFHTYVAHGLGSGKLFTDAFSNQRNSRASSFGVFNTERSYVGSHGISVRLFGLDPGFNDHAAQRAIVMHGAWYVDEAFIQRYGRPGRSWGCPAVPERLIDPIVTTIRYGSLVVMYYPDHGWLTSSRYLKGWSSLVRFMPRKLIPSSMQPLEPVVYLDTNGNHHYQEFKPVIAMSATEYQHRFKQKPPLSRMLRRRLIGDEYIALTPVELIQLGEGPQHAVTATTLNAALRLVRTEVYREGAFYKTRLLYATPSDLQQLQWTALTGGQVIGHAVSAKQVAVPLVATTQFIRWIGL